MGISLGYIKSVGPAMGCEECKQSMAIEGPVDINGKVTFTCPHCGHKVVATVRLNSWLWASNFPVSG